MNSYITNLSKHCYYGNLTNMLNFNDIDISEAELVLLSDALNCNTRMDNHLFFGFVNQACERGLEQIGFQINQIDYTYASYKSLLDERTPILLMINSGMLTHSNIFTGTDKNHYIVLLNDNNETVEISDSFIQTIPMSTFQGETYINTIKNEIQANKANGVYLNKLENEQKHHYSIENLIVNYIKMNAAALENSAIFNLRIFCDMAIKNSSYDIKVAGAVARFDYLIELFKNCFDYSSDIEILTLLKAKWELIANKLMKCSMTLKKDYYVKIFETEIPDLINKERSFYQELCKSGGFIND